MAFIAARALVPIEYMVVTTAGSPVGIAEIANATPETKMASSSWSLARPSSTIARKASPAIPAIRTVSRSSCFWSGVLSASVLLSSSAIWPISVSMPVPVTIISPRPRVTAVCMKAMLTRSPKPTSGVPMDSVAFSVGVLSPVRAASSISRVAATKSRPSAGTMFPASMRTMSPGTRSLASTSTASPLRRTRAMVFIVFSRAARLASAFDS